MLDMMVVGFSAIFSFKIMLLILGGVAIGMIFGSLPGLTTTMAFALFLPLTFGMDSIPAMSLLMGVYIGGVSGGLISAIMLNIPGTPASIATTFDGHKMAKNGEAGRALGIAIVCSFIGGLASIVLLVLLAPPLANVALKFGPFEYFAIGIFSLTMISTLSGDSLIKGLLSGVFGIAMTLVGTAPIDGFPRLTFGIDALDAGFNLLPVLIGLFAVSQIIEMSLDDPENIIEKITNFKIKGLGITLKEFSQQAKNMIRSICIGAGVGILPGVGSGTSNLLAYLVSKKQSKYPEKYGTGIIDGIVASESSNNATIGGALIPLLTVGIPGDTITAILLGGLILHGLTPGPLLFITNGEVVYSIFASLFIANIFMAILSFSGIKMFLKILDIPKRFLYPIILVLCVIGAFGLNNNIFDVWSLLFFGLVGYIMSKNGFPTTPMILGFILGPIVEINLRRGLMHSGGSFIPFVTKPIAAFFLAIAVLSVVLNIWQQRKSKKEREIDI